MTATATYRSSPIRRSRRSAADINGIKAAIVEVLETEQPMTVRQVFYRLVSHGVIAKTEAEYKQTVGRLLSDMRRDGTIPYGWIADATRWMRKPTTYDSVEAALQATAKHYRRAIWRDLPDYVEVWCEKEALAGVLVQVTDQYDVPLMVTRGYPSISYLYSAAETIAARCESGKHVTIYYLGDFDPSGVDIRRNGEEQLRSLAGQLLLPAWLFGVALGDSGAGEALDLSFAPLAVHDWQIDEYGLQTRPTKQSDSRSRTFGADSVELDAIPPTELRELVRRAIEGHIPEGALDKVSAAEESEREILTNIAATMGRVA